MGSREPGVNRLADWAVPALEGHLGVAVPGHVMWLQFAVCHRVPKGQERRVERSQGGGRGCKGFLAINVCSK
jgi:hypothetical protein